MIATQAFGRTGHASTRVICRVLALALLLSFLVTGCGADAPTASPVPAATNRLAVEPTGTPLPPSTTPVPPTLAAVLPTATDSPLPPPTATSQPPATVPAATRTAASLLVLETNPQLFGRSETFQVGLGDVDGDGDLDAVLANMAAHDSQVWFNDGLGTFHDSGQKLTQQGHGLGLGDLDGDGDLDILMTCAHYGRSGAWSQKPSRVYLNDGLGTFHDSGQDLGDTELSGNGVNLIDLDGDGDLDAHVIYYEVDGMADRVYLNDGGVQGGTLGRFSDSGLALAEEEIAWGDLDADGDVDMLAKAYGQGYRVLLNDGGVQGGTPGHFVAGWQMEDSQAMYGDLALADLDGDGDLDALVASGFRSEGSFPTRLLWNDGHGQFEDSGQELNATMAARFAVGDLNGDGSLDVFVSNGDQRRGEAWLNDGAGRLVDSGLRLASPSRHLATWPSLGDLDGDGDLDLVEAGFHGKAEVWLNQAPLPSAAQGHGSIAFYSDRDGSPEIYVMSSDGSDQRRLTFNAFEDSSPDWSPDGSQIAFISDRDDPRPGHCFPDCAYQIYLIDADGSGEHKLLDTEFRALHPDWHPDGSRLSFDTEFNLEGDIYVAKADGSGLQRLIEDGFWADWSPDGTQIVFASRRDGNVELYLADADGGNQRRLTYNRYLDYFPAWSPDGRRIAFARLETKQIHVMNADGSDERQLTQQQHAENPSWSPDGAELVFQSDSEGTFEIYAIQVEDILQGKEGSDPRRLTENRAADMWPSWASTPESDLYLGQTPPGLEVETFAPGIVSIEDRKEYKVTISPDLQEILFTRRTPGGRDDRLWYSRLENGKLAMPELAPFTYDAFETDACFTPDGNRLYYKSARPLPGAQAASRLPNVWFVDRTETGWSEPQFAGAPLNDYQPVYFSFANDGTLYFTRSSPRGIYYAEPEEGEYREAHRLPDEVNHVREIAHPAIAPDESYLVVDSAYEQGGRLVGSLYVSFRGPDGSWTPAVSLHDALRATEADVYGAPRISPDGKYLFFEKYDRETDRSDLYWVSTDVIRKLGLSTHRDIDY